MVLFLEQLPPATPNVEGDRTIVNRYIHHYNGNIPAAFEGEGEGPQLIGLNGGVSGTFWLLLWG